MAIVTPCFEAWGERYEVSFEDFQFVETNFPEKHMRILYGVIFELI